MNKIKSTSKSKVKEAHRKRIIIRVIVALLVLIVIAVVVFWAFIEYFVWGLSKSKSQYETSTTRSQAASSLQQQAKRINLPGQLVYDKIIDQGCSEQSTSNVFYPNYTSCSFALGKYYKSSGNPELDLKKANEALNTSDLVVANEQDLSQLLKKDKGADWISYKDRGDSGTLGGYSFNVFFYGGDNYYKTPKSFFRYIDQDLQINPGEYIYGISILKNYKQNSN